MSAKEMRKSALRRYIVFRVKAMEFLDMGGLHQGLLTGNIKPYPPFRSSDDMAGSLRTVLVSWLALFIDKNGMNVIKLWKEIYPHHAKRVDDAWAKMEPTWPIIRDFRNSAGFHADNPTKFFGKRHALRKEIKKVEAAMVEFGTLFKFFLKAEETELPELETALDSLLDDLEKSHGSAFKPADFKHYVMIKDTKSASAVKK